MNICLIIIITLFSLLPCTAQVADKFEQPKDFRIVLSKPSAYISFERYVVQKPAYEGESGNSVLLRFHNNTKWNLNVRTNGCRNEKEECSVFHQVMIMPDYKDKIKDSEVPYGYSPHVATVRTVKSGGSILFSLPKEKLREGLYITVDFSYEWEITGFGGGGGLGIRHQVGFFSWELPETK